jgi:hypothetical protein
MWIQTELDDPASFETTLGGAIATAAGELELDLVV